MYIHIHININKQITKKIMSILWSVSGMAMITDWYSGWAREDTLRLSLALCPLVSWTFAHQAYLQVCPMIIFYSTDTIISILWHIQIVVCLTLYWYWYYDTGAYLGDEDSLVSRTNKEVALVDSPLCWFCVDVGRTRAINPTMLCLRHGCPQQVKI